MSPLASTPNTLTGMAVTSTPTTTEGATCLPWPVLRTYSLAWLLHLHLQQQRGPRVSPGQYSEHTRWRGRYINYTYNRGRHVSPLASTPNILAGVAVT